MARDDTEKLLVSLDVGTATIEVLVAEQKADGGVEIIGMGSQPSRGIKRGVVVDIESTTRAIQRAVEQAELAAECEIRGVVASISGSHISSQNSQGMVPVREREVETSDVGQVLEAARAVNLPADRHLLHALPQEYIIDDQDGIQYPVGMAGVRLEVRAHLVTCAESAVLNISKCITRCGLELEDLVAQPLASAEAVLNEDEKELGVCLVDMGAGTTDIAVYTGGAVRLTRVIPVAGEQVTNDIAVALRTPTQHAEDLKLRYACAMTSMASADEVIQVPGVSGKQEERTLSRQLLAEVVQPRYEELFSLIKNELVKQGFDGLLAGGVVLTGGAVRMEGVQALAEDVLDMPVRLGDPAAKISGLVDMVRDARHSAGVGLLLWEEEYQQGPGRRREAGWWEKFKKWFRGEL